MRPAARATPKRARGAAARAFLFSDLRDYTTFVETKGDRAAAALLRDYRALIRREVARFEGAEVKTEGDSFYVVFESPSTALDCAVAIARKCAAHNEKEPERPLKVGIGIHAGETVAFDSQFVGSAVNVASRLGSHARAGEVIVSDTLRGLVRTGQDYPMTDLGPLSLKGVSERIHAWSVTALESTAPPVTLPPPPASHSRPAAGQILCPVLIGRESELALIETALDAAAGGAGQTIVVAGEAGGGKSAFVRAVESRAHARGFRLLRGATLESDRTLPYAPFVAAVRSGFRGIEHERLGRVLGQTAPDLAQLFPELGRGDRSTASMEQHRLSVAFHGLFTAFAREGPILIVVEDLHWSDEASLDLLHSLSREMRDSRCVLIANYRSDEMHRRHPFLRTLGNLQRERLATEITLRRLTADEVGRLIQETFASSEATSAEFRDAVFARSEGNPFFTEELLKAMVDSGGIYRTPTGWERKPIAQLRIPSSIRESVRARVERLSPEAQAALSAASVIGLRFPFEVLRATSGASAADLLAHLRAFIELQLVVEEGGDEDSYSFRHALTREVVYDELLAPERKALHRAVAMALGASPRVEPGLLALHLIAAGDATSAVPHVIAAAKRAHAADAPREAASGYEQALEIGVPDEQLGPVLEALATAYQPFAISRARRAAERAAERYREAGDRRGLSRALLLEGEFAAMLGDSRGLALLTEAMDVVDDLGDTPELANALIQLGGYRAATGEWQAVGELGVRVARLAEHLDDPRPRYGAALLRGISLVDRAPEEALRLMTQARDAARAGGLIAEVLNAWWWMTSAVQRTARPASELEAMAQEGLRYARDHGVESTAVTPMPAYYHLNHGNWDAALAAASAIEPSNGYYDNALEILGRIAEGRDGPVAGSALYVRQAEQWMKLAGGATAPSLIASAYAALLRGEHSAVAAVLDELATMDHANLVRISDTRLLLCVALLRRTDWLDIVEPLTELGDNLDSRRYAIVWKAARAFVAGDAAGCARLLASTEELGSAPWYFGLDTDHVEVTLAFARSLREAGATLGPEWDAPLRSARAFAERAKATHWLAQLPA